MSNDTPAAPAILRFIKPPSCPFLSLLTHINWYYRVCVLETPCVWLNFDSQWKRKTPKQLQNWGKRKVSSTQMILESQRTVHDWVHVLCGHDVYQVQYSDRQPFQNTGNKRAGLIWQTPLSVWPTGKKWVTRSSYRRSRSLQVCKINILQCLLKKNKKKRPFLHGAFHGWCKV